MKCFSIDVPAPSIVHYKHTNVKYLKISFNATVFPNETRPTGAVGPLTRNSFGIQFHYPGQRMRATVQNWRWKSHSPGDLIVMRYTFFSMTVLRSRNKRNNPCNENWRGDDKFIMGTGTFDASNNQDALDINPWTLVLDTLEATTLNVKSVKSDVVIGEDSTIYALTVIGGSTIIGKNSKVLLGASIINKVIIGDEVQIGIGAVVVRNLPCGIVVFVIRAKILI